MNITEASKEIIKFWFSNESLWFNCTEQDDLLITEKFIGFLDIFNVEDRGCITSNPKTLLAAIILYDQMTRHFYRNSPEKWQVYNHPACELVYIGIQKNYESVYLKDPNKYCFFLIPLRHSKKVSNINVVIDKIKGILNNGIYKRFYYHTLKDLALILNKEFNKEIYFNKLITDTMLYFTVIDRPWFSFSKSMYNISLTNRRNKFIDSIYNIVIANNLKNVCVSLSGGVDSMLITACMLTLREQKIINSITAVHINYGNRYKSMLEKEFVVRFCWYHNIKLIVRDINEIKRTRHCRDIYEDITRFIRFDIYKRVNLPVFLGHNLDDCLENLVTNIKKSKNLNNLFGMTEKSVNCGITLYRPFLKFSKTSIHEMASELNLCHTKNSTPKWCDRWNIRNIFLRFVERYQPGFTNGLINIRETLEQTYLMINGIISEMSRDISIVNQENMLIVEVKKRNINCFVWEIWSGLIIHHVCICNGIPVPSHKSIRNFVKHLDSNNSVNLGLNFSAKINSETVMFSYINCYHDLKIVKK